jgi:hypothetical protein
MNQKATIRAIIATVLLLWAVPSSATTYTIHIPVEAKNLDSAVTGIKGECALFSQPYHPISESLSETEIIPTHCCPVKH